MARPTKYKKEYCEQLIKHLESGLSYDTFCAVIHCHKDSLYEWEKKHPEFSEAKKIGLQYNKLFWEKLGIAGAAGRIPNFNCTAWIFNMKNRHHWRDKQEIEHSGNPNKPIKYESMSEEQIDNLIKSAVSLLKDE